MTQKTVRVSPLEKEASRDRRHERLCGRGTLKVVDFALLYIPFASSRGLKGCSDMVETVGDTWYRNERAITQEVDGTKSI